MAAAASTSSFSKLSAPLRHLLLRQSAVALSGKLVADRALPVFSQYQKPVLAEAGIGAVDMMLFGRVESPVTRTAIELAMKKKRKDTDKDDDDIVPLIIIGSVLNDDSSSDTDGSDDIDVDSDGNDVSDDE